MSLSMTPALGGNRPGLRSRLQQVADPLLAGRPRLALALLGVLAAGIDVRTRDLGLGGPASNPLELVLLIAGLLLLADAVVWPRQPWAMLRTAFTGNRWLVLYFAWALIAGVAGMMKLTLSVFVFRNLLPAFVVFVLLVYSMRSVQDIRRLLVVFLVAALPNVVLGLVQRVRGGPFPVGLNLASTMKMDLDGTLVISTVSGLFSHPNGLSIFLLPVVLVAFGLAIAPARIGIWRRLFAMLVFGAAIVLMYFTRAKGAWAWTLYGMVLLMLPRRTVAWRGAWLAQILVLAALIVAITLVSLHVGGSLRTMGTRVLLWKSTIVAAQTDPVMALLGSGQLVVWQVSARLADLQYPNAHNVFLNQLVNFGLPAAVLYVLAFVGGIRSACTTFRLSQDAELRWYAKIAFTVLLAIAGQYFFEPVAEASGIALCLFVFMAIAAVSSRLMLAPKAAG